MKATVKLFTVGEVFNIGESHVVIPKDVAEKAIKEFNRKLSEKHGKTYGSFRAEENSPVLMKRSHEVIGCFMDSNGTVCMDINVLDTFKGLKLKGCINDDKGFTAEILGLSGEKVFLANSVILGPDLDTQKS